MKAVLPAFYRFPHSMNLPVTPTSGPGCWVLSIPPPRTRNLQLFLELKAQALAWSCGICKWCSSIDSQLFSHAGKWRHQPFPYNVIVVRRGSLLQILAFPEEVTGKCVFIMWVQIWERWQDQAHTCHCWDQHVEAGLWLGSVDTLLYTSEVNGISWHLLLLIHRQARVP